MPIKAPTRVQPQCVEAADGYPQENRCFCGSYDEMLAVAAGVKPCAIVSRGDAAFARKPVGLRGHVCPTYTLEEVEAYCRGKLLSVPYSPGASGMDAVIVCRADSLRGAVLLQGAACRRTYGTSCTATCSATRTRTCALGTWLPACRRYSRATSSATASGALRIPWPPR